MRLGKATQSPIYTVNSNSIHQIDANTNCKLIHIPCTSLIPRSFHHPVFLLLSVSKNRGGRPVIMWVLSVATIYLGRQSGEGRACVRSFLTGPISVHVGVSNVCEAKMLPLIHDDKQVCETVFHWAFLLCMSTYIYIGRSHKMKWTRPSPFVFAIKTGHWERPRNKGNHIHET